MSIGCFCFLSAVKYSVSAVLSMKNVHNLGARTIWLVFSRPTATVISPVLPLALQSGVMPQRKAVRAKGMYTTK